MNANAAQLDRIIRMGEVIARHGITGAGMDVLLLAHDARDLGVDDVVIDVLIDEAAPAVVRERAFARVASALICTLEGERYVSATPALEMSSPAGAMR
jgi:hypothetical protein